MSSDVCRICCRELAAQLGNSNDLGPAACTIIVESGKKFGLHLSLDFGQAIKGRWLRETASDLVGQELGEMLMRSATGGMRAVQDDEVMDQLPAELHVKFKSNQ